MEENSHSLSYYSKRSSIFEIAGWKGTIIKQYVDMKHKTIVVSTYNLVLLNQWIIRYGAVFLFLFFLARPVYAQPIRYKYFRKVSANDAGSIHLGIINEQERDLVFKALYVNGRKVSLAFDPGTEDPITGKKRKWTYFPPGAKPGHVLWYYFTEPAVKPGKAAELIVKFAKTPLKPVEVKVETEGGQVLSLVIEPRPMPLSISFIGFNDDFSKAYIYVHNKGDTDFWIDTVELYSEDIQKRLTGSSLRVQPGSKVCVPVKLPRPAHKGERFYVIVTIKEGITFGASVRAFTGFPISGVDDDGLDYKQVVSHYGLAHDQFDIVGSRIITNLTDPRYLKPGQMAYYLCNQGLIKYGAPYFGELCDASLLHTEPSEVAYLGQYNEKDFHYTQAKTRYIKECVEPNRLFAVTETAHAYGEFYKEMFPEEVRLRAYYNISRGAKGLSWRLGYLGQYTENSRKLIRQEVSRINQELTLLRPLLRIGDNVDNMADTSGPLVEASTILGGDRGILLILFNHDRSFAWPEYERINKKPFWIVPKPDPLQITVRLPQGAQAKDLYEVGGDWIRPRYTIRNDELSFIIDGIETTRQFVIAFDHSLYKLDSDANGIPDIDQVKMAQEIRRLRKPKKMDKVIFPTIVPDIQFVEKQYNFGTIDPKQEMVTHIFPFRNIGGKPLVINSPSKISSDIEVTISEKTLTPGEEGEVNAAFLIQGKSGKQYAEFYLTTNDPNEQKIKLEIGGIVKPELLYYPQVLRFSDGVSEKKITIVDQRRGRLKINKIISSCSELSTQIETETRTIVDSYSDVFHGERILNVHYITVISNSKDDPKGFKTNLEIHTNSNYYPVINIPVVMEPSIFVEIYPKNIFFGLVEKGTTKALKINITAKKGELLIIKKVESPFDYLTVKVTKTRIDAYELTASLTEEVPVGSIKNALKIYTNNEQQPIVEIPVYALIKDSTF